MGLRTRAMEDKKIHAAPVRGFKNNKPANKE
jgi:hypothetical protein